MKPFQVGLLGAGVVGGGTFAVLQRNQEEIRRRAGREIRILVRPEEMDDLASSRLARDVVKKIEEQLQYPGQIKVTVIRETRAVEYAK